MSSILITGGTGKLGKCLASLLQEQNVDFTIGSRRNASGAANFAVMDLLENRGVQEAVRDKQLIFHLATDLKRDCEATKNLLKALKPESGVHLVYASIVGIDKVPFGYYKQKVASENAIKRSGVAFTILRATQFHEFIDQLLSGFLRYPIGLLPKDVVSQPIETRMVAKELYRLSQERVANATYEIGGPETWSFGQMASMWLQHTGKSRWIINIPLWGNLGRAFRIGSLTTGNVCSDSIRWKQWLAQKYAT